MRIQVFHSKSGGPGVFMRRLVDYLVNHFDVKIVENKPDIYFSAVWRGNPPKGAKVVHRADNCYFNTLQHKRTGANKAVKLAIDKADAVVFQSEFSRKICRGVLKTHPKRVKIIYNAIDQSAIKNVEPIKHKFDKLLIGCALWRPLKRPKSIVKAFEKASIPNSQLIMIGKYEQKYKSQNVQWIGQISSQETYKYYAACNALIHISRLDACPNSVIEALSFGKPVIGNNAGGTPELIGKDGIIVKIDPEDNYKEFPMRNPEDVNIEVISNGIKECLSNGWLIDRLEFDMLYCAKQYRDYFLQILGG